MNLGILLEYIFSAIFILVQLFFIKNVNRKLNLKIKNIVLRIFTAYIISELIMYLVAYVIIIGSMHFYPKVSLLQVIFASIGRPFFSEPKIIF